MSEQPRVEVPRDWTFKSTAIAQDFDRHVREQLPWYDLATNAVGFMVRQYLERGGLVYDIGCATGNVGREIAATLDDREAYLVGIDNSPEMGQMQAGIGEFEMCDAVDFNYEPFDVAVLFLTLMFIPHQRREILMETLRKRVKQGGAIIVFDKMEPASGYTATVMHRLTLAGKVAAGVPSDEIIAKELSLGGVQRPIKPGLLGLNATEWFRFGDFAGWLLE